MPLRTAEEYLASLKDNRVVYINGERVPDVTAHPILSIGARHAALDYRLAEDPENAKICLATSELTNDTISRFFNIPRTPEDLLARFRVIEFGTRKGNGIVLFIKEIGTDILFTLLQCCKRMDRDLGTDYFKRAMDYWKYCSENDLAMVGAVTDVKGDRSKRPSKQSDPDMYVRIVEKNSDGIVVKGAKAHTTAGPFCNEILVTPTRAFVEGDGDYAVAFGIPADTEGVILIARPQELKDSWEYPQAAKNVLSETTTIFENVFIPWERVFMCGEWQYAGLMANVFATWHRFTGLSYKGPVADLMLGSAQLIAEYNGVPDAKHIQSKIGELITYANTIRVFARESARECEILEEVAYPHQLNVNIGKHYFAENFHAMTKNVQEIAGGAVVTAPSSEDWNNPEIRPYIEKYYKGVDGVPTEDRLKALKLIKDLTASDEAGVWFFGTVHGEGSLEAQRISTYRGADLQPYVEFAKKVAGI
ncbi:4-hydroxyphenylacetate 3-hydroxylase family protein [Thermodesulfobacteriota bacterium]